jgi:hypothetical protein
LQMHGQALGAALTLDIGHEMTALIKGLLKRIKLGDEVAESLRRLLSIFLSLPLTHEERLEDGEDSIIEEEGLLLLLLAFHKLIAENHLTLFQKLL